MNESGYLLIVAGVGSVTAAILDWGPLPLPGRRRIARPEPRRAGGRVAARWLYGVLGVALTALGVALAMGVVGAG